MTKNRRILCEQAKRKMSAFRGKADRAITAKCPLLALADMRLYAANVRSRR